MGIHLLVLVHGVWGTVKHFDYICTQLEAAGAIIDCLDEVPEVGEDEEQLVVYRARSNQGYFTYDGIDVCGTRVADEVCAEITRLKAVTRLSIMGYSLGGIISRFAVGVLDRRGVFDQVEPCNFTTFGTPHVGVVVLGNRWTARSFNNIGAKSMSVTSRQLFLRDTYLHGMSLLEYMADPSMRFAQALGRFRHLSLYANVVNDHRCEWYTSAIDASDPYAGRSPLLKGPYVEGYKPVVLDIARAPLFREDDGSALASKSLMVRLGNYAVAAFKLAVVTPLWFVCFLTNATFQNVTSTYRRSRFMRAGLLEEDLAIERKKMSRRSSFSEALKDQSESVTEMLEEGADDVVESMYKAVTASSELELDEKQQRIVKSLNSLPWQKFPVHITQHHHSHAAIIVRYRHKGFEEGKIVVKHWIDSLYS
ncbi:lipid droplet phospholipase 1 [Trichomonascus vanleenenianus]|uniref:lipase ROG1 family protein n=1 Tax=Trichomonascus vanleenenianus TaxID=2268995 RepID=UPI003ECA01D4